jgi:prolyl-tRNA synthetase
MLYTNIFPKTSREVPKGNHSPGTEMLYRGGYLDPVASGIFLTPHLLLLVRRNVEQIVREEMNRAGAIELELSILQPRSLWDETGRWNDYVSSQTAFHLIDRKGAEFMLAPTAEEVVTSFAQKHLKSPTDVPVNFYQISPKFRDEIRPRQGLIRVREFVMKDAYSFDQDEAGMKQSYKNMEQAYHAIFKRIGFDYIQVEADSGSIGGSGSSEFMAITDVGEDVLLHCPNCGYGGNQEKATAYFPAQSAEDKKLERLETPNIRTVAELEEFTGFKANQMVKTIVMMADDKPVIVSMRGDLEISTIKLGNLLGAKTVETAAHSVVEEVTGAPVGFAGPINLYGKTDVTYLFDRSVEHTHNFLCGANQEDVHYINVVSGRDFPEIQEFHDLSNVTAGQHCSSCEAGIFEEKRGIELGHIFQLQTVYSEKLSATYLDGSGNPQPFWMGCYGIGVSRIAQAMIEQNHDDRGPVWPMHLAPYVACVMAAKPNGMQDAEMVYNELCKSGFACILDDREKARMGEKLTDAELRGWPLTVVVGRDWDEHRKLEVRWRNRQQYPNDFTVTKEGGAPTASMSVNDLISFLTKQKTQNK